MNRRTAFALLLVLVGAFALRVPKLGTRPLHNDEAVNAIKVSELWQHGRYAYDPDEYHGPTLHYATLPFLWLSGARTANELNDATLRLAPVMFGAGLILLLLFFADGLGRHALLWAAVFIAISPAMVFYSRYFIHEMLLVFFTLLTLGAGWRYVQARAGSAGILPASSTGDSRRQDAGALSFWAVVAGAGLGLMFATKETFVLSVAAMGLAGIITAWWTLPKPKKLKNLRALWNWKHAALALGTTFVIWLLLFSSFFTNFHGLADSIRTYLPWLKRAGGHSPHIHPWNFYLERLAWFHPAKGPVWSEGLVLVLALVGALVSLFGKKSALHRFLALFTICLTAIYSVISYKTPWCLLNFYLGMILLAGVGAAALVEFLPVRWVKVAAVQLILLLALQLIWQSLRANFNFTLERGGRPVTFAYAADRRNPYVYAQTVPDLLSLVQRTDGIARVAPAGFETVVKVIAPQGDYWPLPWSLRRFQNLGWYEKLPDEPLAPIMIVAANLDARLDDKSGKKWIMVGLTELRPGKFFEQYVELELWKKYVETLPRERE